MKTFQRVVHPREADPKRPHQPGNPSAEEADDSQWRTHPPSNPGELSLFLMLMGGNSEFSVKHATIVSIYLQLHPQWVFKYLSHSLSCIVHNPSAVYKVLFRYPLLCLGLCIRKLLFFFSFFESASRHWVKQQQGRQGEPQYHRDEHPHKSWGAQGGARKWNIKQEVKTYCVPCPLHTHSCTCAHARSHTHTPTLTIWWECITQ